MLSSRQNSSRRLREGFGLSMTWLSGGALALNLVLILGLLVLIGAKGLGFFWQQEVVELELHDGRRILGEINLRELVPESEWMSPTEPAFRIRLKVGNRDLTGADFVWVDESQVKSRTLPADVVMLERLEWGNFYGRLVELKRGSDDGGAATTVSGVEAVWKALPTSLSHVEALRREVAELERNEIGRVNFEIEKLRLEQRGVELASGSAAEKQARSAKIASALAVFESQYAAAAERLFARRHELERDLLVLEASDGTRKELAVGQVVHALRPNTLSWFSKLKLYLGRSWEFVAGQPRESNTEGGIFPAIFGTVMMVLLMSLVVTPLGVLAALYLREYAKQGPLVRMVRIAVNNLAGVPSIVFGVFGLGFFVYLIGGSIDQLFYPEALPTPTFGTGGILWASLTLALLTVPVVIVATEEGLAAVPRIVREGALALGATKFETTWKVVVPAAAPGILTGMILAMARAAGEVAPLMIVGMVKLAPALPVDGYAPFIHLERKFMHLGFHIYDVGFQSPNIEATTPLVFATAFLLIAVVTAMNLVAVAVRNRLRKKYKGSAV